MRKLTKKALSLVLSLLLVISAISGALSISAETVVNEAPLNLDFSSGLDHWTGTDINKATVADGGITFVSGQGNWNKVATERFKIPNLKVGQELEFSMKIDYDSSMLPEGTTLGGNFARLGVHEYDATGAKISADKDYTSLSNSGITTGTYTLKRTVTVSYVDQAFELYFYKADAPFGTRYYDFQIKTTGDLGQTLIYTNGAPKVIYLNLDFSDGFDHWKNTDKVEINNGAVIFTEGRGPWIYLQTEDFKIPNLQVGDKVEFSRVVTVLDPELIKTAKYTNVFRTIFTTSADNWTAKDAVNQIDYHASITDKSGDAATGLLTTHTSGAVSSTALTVTDPEQAFRIQIAMGNGIATAVSISNMKIVVTKADGISYIYTNSTTPAVGYFDGNVPGGTEADGYTTSSSGAVLKYPVLSAPTNLDFSEGLKYWAPYRENNPTTTSTSTYASVDENGILTLKRIDDKQWKQGITSQKFAVSNVAVGDTIRFIFEYDFDDENGKKRDFLFRANGYTADGTQNNQLDLGCLNNTNYFDKAPGEISDTGWRTYSKDLTVKNIDDVYTISLAYYGNTKIEDGADTATKFRNIRVVKVLSDGAYLDLATNEKVSADLQPFGGTEEKGIEIKPIKGIPSIYADTGLFQPGTIRTKEIYGTTTNLVNGDFSQGFKYWFAGNYDANFPEYTSLGDIATVENGIVKFNTAVDDNGNKYNPGLYSLPFYIQGINANDVLVLAVDVRNAPTASSIQLQLREMAPHATSTQYYNCAATAPSNFFNAASATEWTTLYNTANLTVLDPSHPFFIRITKSADDAAEFKNIRIYKINSATGEITLVNNGYNADNNFNKDGGSVENGMMELGGAYAQSTPAVNKLTNLDFSQGLKYWAPKNLSRAMTSDVAKVEADGSVTVTKIATCEGIQTAPITFSEEYVGKEFALWAYYTLNGTVELSYYENGTRLGAFASGDTKWHQIRIPEIKADAKYTFEIKTFGSVNVKNLKLVTPVAHSNGVNAYVDLDGNKFLGSAFDFQPYGGTDADGIVVSSNGTGLPTGSYWGQTRTHMSANDGLVNPDFSEGFKYWMVNAIGGKASEILTLENGVVSYKEDCTKQYAGLYSQAFTLKNSGIKVGDVVYAALDVSNTPSSMGVGLVSYYQDDLGNWSELYTKNGGGSGPVSADKWSTIYSGATMVENLNQQFFVKIEKGYTEGQGSFKNARILRNDRGQLVKIDATTGEMEYVSIRVNADGSLQNTQVYGDANYDGKADLLDLVRIKKYAAGATPYGIFLAAVDADKDDVVSAKDFSAVVAWIFDAKK